MGFFNSDKGNAAIEVALLLPVLLIVTLGGVDLFRYFFQNLILEMSSQQILYLAGHATETVTHADIQRLFQQYIGDFSRNILIYDGLKFGEIGNSGNFLTVEIQYPFKAISPFVWLSLVPENLTYMGMVYVDA